MLKWRIDYLDGDFEFVALPPVWIEHKGAEVLSQDMLNAYLQELRNAIAGRNIWPIESAGDLFSEFGLYFRKLSELFRPQLDPGRMTPESRHEFFICTEPFPGLHDPEQLLPGLSGLEQLLGYSYQVASDKPKARPRLEGTGTPDLDVLTSALLMFKEAALPLAHKVSTTALAKMIGFANDQIALASEKDGDKPKAPPEAREEPKADDVVAVNADEIAATLAEQGIMMPPI